MADKPTTYVKPDILTLQVNLQLASVPSETTQNSDVVTEQQKVELGTDPVNTVMRTVFDGEGRFRR